MFDKKAFSKANFVPRTEQVSVSSLADWFEGDPLWTVRGLSFEELSRADSKADQTQTMIAVIEALSGGDKKEQATAIQEALGMGDNTPPQMIKRLEMLVIGSVSPEIDLPIAVKLAENFPVEFKELTDKIITLTGQGRVLGKQKGSGSKQKSETQ